jgi:hypothetical protein
MSRSLPHHKKMRYVLFLININKVRNKVISIIDHRCA